MKKMISLLSALAASALCFFPASAASPAFSVTDASGKPGDRVTVRVEISDNPGIIAFHLLVDYDSDVLSVAAAKGGIFTGTSFGPKDRDPFSFLWSDAVSGDYTDSGTIAELTFIIKEDAAGGEYPVSLSYSPDDVFNYDLENVSFETKAGRITVTGSSSDASTSAADSSHTSAAESSSADPDSKAQSGADTSSEAVSSSPGTSSSSALPDSSSQDSSLPDSSEMPPEESQDAASTEKKTSTAAESAVSSLTETAAEAVSSDFSSASASDISEPASPGTEKKKGPPAALLIGLAAGTAAAAAAVILLRKKGGKGK